jgi:AhpD family alkylhydroperoxidase
MTRIPYCQPAQMSSEARAMTLQRGNLNVYRTLANADTMFTGWMAAGHAALTSPVLSARLRELVILRTGHLMNCPYEVAQHTALARGAGIADQQIEELAVGGSLSASSGFDDTELAVLGLTTELLLTKQVDAALFKAVHQALGTKATIVVLMLINRWSGLALMINALEIDLDTRARIAIPHPQH